MVHLILALCCFAATCALAAAGSVSQITFTIAPGDRVASIASVPVTLVFTTEAALAINGEITLDYPAGFFAGTPNPAGVSTFLFTTQSYSAAGGTITITLPTNYFSAKASPAGLLIGTIVCTTVTAVLAAGAHTITFAAGESTTAGAFVAANSFMITTSGNDQSAATEIEVIAVPMVKSVSMAMGAADNFTTIVKTALTTFCSNQNQTQHPSPLQAWQDKLSPPRPQNQGILICSTTFELKPSTTCMPSPPVTQNHVSAKPHATAVCEAHLIPDTIQQYLVLISDSKPFPFKLVKTMGRTRLSVPCTSDNPAPSTYYCIHYICVCTTHQGSIHVGFCCWCGCFKNMVEAASHFGYSTNAAPSVEIGITFLHLFAENALVPVTSTFTPATHMPSHGSMFLRVVMSYLKEKNQPKRCTNNDSTGHHLLVHFGYFHNTPQMSPTHCSDDVSTTFAKGKIESIAVDLIAHGSENLWTGARALVPQTPHVTRLTNARYHSQCVADFALPM